MRPNSTAFESTSIVEPSFEPRTTPEIEKIDLIGSIPFFAVHVGAVAGLFFMPITWQAIALCLGSYYARMFFVTGAYHRYFSHRTFKTSRAFQFLLALFGSMTVQKGVLWWAANHRHHHKFSDMPEDIHSPVQRGFWWSHSGWLLSRKYNDTMHDQIRDLNRFPELMWLNKYYLVPPVAFAVGLALIGGFWAFYWGFIVSTVLLWHGTALVNSLTHVWGTRRYETTDGSRNNFWIALLTMGEGWHNNHHHYMNSCAQGFFWWEIDPTYYILKGLEKLGIVWDVKRPPEHLLKKTS